MFALPILTRELRSRARKPWTAWVRVLVGLFATLMAASTLSWAQRATGMPWLPGKILLDSLGAILFVFCLVEGARQTSDCLSQEKREGTLGLLFLTDLSGLDVVMGKLAATSLGSFFVLLAAFPVMAVALVAGGVTAGEFWRTVLVLLNALFAGLAWGMWASARSRVEGRELLSGLAGAFAVTLVPWIFEFILRPAGLPNISLSVALHLADDTVYSGAAPRFWMTLGLAHALSWVLLAAAGRIVETSWREDTSPLPAASIVQTPSLGTELNKAPARIQEYWPVRMDDDPAGWLSRRQLRHGYVIWLSMASLGLGPHLAWVGMMIGAGSSSSTGGLYTAIDSASAFLPVMLLLFIASRFFAEARRGGEIELLLLTPLSAREIVLGRWRALWLRMRSPLVVALALVGFMLLLMSIETNLPFGFGWEFTLYATAQSAERLLCGLATCWLGLYLGLRFESVLRAVGIGLLWLVIGPWLVASMFWLFMSSLLPKSLFIGASMPVLLVQLFPAVVGCLYLGGVLAWSRRQLIQRLRELAARS